MANPENRRMNRSLRLDKDLDVVAEHHHEVSGARLILAHERDATGETFVTAWVAPWQRTIRDYVRHGSEAGAQADFQRKKGNEPPVTSALRRDWQVSAFYNWENITICRHDSYLTPEHMQKVAKHVAQDFNLEAVPVISARKNRLRSSLADYSEDRDEIRVRQRMWRLSYVLHELAHAIDVKVNGNKWSDHGPSYARTLLTVVEKYKYWHDAENLEKSAADAGISIAPADSLPNLQKPKIQ